MPIIIARFTTFNKEVVLLVCLCWQEYTDPKGWVTMGLEVMYRSGGGCRNFNFRGMVGLGGGIHSTECPSKFCCSLSFSSHYV